MTDRSLTGVRSMPGEWHHRAAGDLVGKTVGGSAGRELVGAAHSALVGAMALGTRVPAGVALISAVAVIVALPWRRHSAVAQAVADRRCDGHARSTSLPSRGSVSVVPLASPTRPLSFETAVCRYLYPTMADRYPTNKRSTND